MGRRGANAGGQHGNQAGVVAAEFGGVADLSLMDRRRRIALAGAWRNRLEGDRHGVLDNSSGPPHKLDLAG